MLSIIHKLSNKAKQKARNEFWHDSKIIYNKEHVLHNIAVVSINKPKGVIENEIYPVVGEDVLRNIADRPLSFDEYYLQKHSAEQGFNFLGVRMVLNASRRSKGKKFCYGFPKNKSMKEVRNKIRREFGKNYQPSLSHKIEYLNPILRGWANYYNWLNSGVQFRKIDKYVTRKLNLRNRTKSDAKKRKYKWLAGSDLYNQGLYKMSGQICYSW